LHFRGIIGLSAPTKSLRSAWHRAVITVIAASRRQAGMRQEDLAAALGWHRSKIAKIESGERRLDVAEFILIAGELQIDPATLICRVMQW
jgi:transcriptional regulator with XRE-family HTH domain